MVELVICKIIPCLMRLQKINELCQMLPREPNFPLIQELQRKLPTPSFLTSIDGRAVADVVWCTPGLACIRELQRKLSTPSFLTSADGRVVADGVQ